MSIRCSGYVSACKRTQVDVAEAAATDLAADAVLVPHAEVLLSGQYVSSITCRVVVCLAGREGVGIGEGEAGVPLSSCWRRRPQQRICFCGRVYEVMSMLSISTERR